MACNYGGVYLKKIPQNRDEKWEILPENSKKPPFDWYNLSTAKINLNKNVNY